MERKGRRGQRGLVGCPMHTQTNQLQLFGVRCREWVLSLFSGEPILFLLPTLLT